MTEENDKTIYEQIIDGDKVAHYGSTPVLAEIGTFSLPGIRPGKSAYTSEEPDTFKKVTDGEMPESLQVDPSEVKKRQDASMDRYEFDPIYRGIVDAFANFIIGAGVQVKAIDEDVKVAAYVDAFNTLNEMDGRDRDIVLKFLKSGECFIRLFTKSRDDRVAKMPVVRVLNYWEIVRIERDPSDVETVIAYIRAYRDGMDVKEERIPADEIIHVKGGCKDDYRGLPPFQSIVKHCAWYEDWVHNRVVYNRLKTSFYLEEVINGTPTNTSSAANQHPTQDQKYGKGGQEILRMPKMGTKITHNKNVEYKWLKPEIRADDASEDGRIVRMAICTGAQCPEFIVGDASNANFASTMVAQNPFVRKIEYFQDMFETYFKELYRRVLSHGVRMSALPKMSTQTETVEKAHNVGFLRKVKYSFRAEEQMNQKGDITKKIPVPTKVEVEIVWPTIIKQNLKEETEAYQIHQAMGVAATSTLSQKLGYDYEEELRKIEKEEAVTPGDDDDGDDDFNKKKKRDLDGKKKKGDDGEDDDGDE